MNLRRATRVAPASCRLSRGRLALGAGGEDARRTAAGTAAPPFATATRSLIQDRQRPDSLFRGRVDGVAECGRDRWYGRFSNAGRRLRAGHGVDFDHRCFVHPEWRVVVEV